ncbi:hypothetical protein CABS01_01896, partial [Colletotrichum abscissum]|uniref:uncharacterized protein n=1 Tax=Colletotrichum abscissum TaxID=1671311 RepID=UPI0027D6F955
LQATVSYWPAIFSCVVSASRLFLHSCGSLAPTHSSRLHFKLQASPPLFQSLHLIDEGVRIRCLGEADIGRPQIGYQSALASLRSNESRSSFSPFIAPCWGPHSTSGALWSQGACPPHFAISQASAATGHRPQHLAVSSLLCIERLGDKKSWHSSAFGHCFGEGFSWSLIFSLPFSMSRPLMPQIETRNKVTFLHSTRTPSTPACFFPFLSAEYLDIAPRYRRGRQRSRRDILWAEQHRLPGREGDFG